MAKKATPNKLRILAEAKAKKVFGSLNEITPLKAKKLFHELEVHQVELEMQNQELLETQLRLEEAYDQYADLFDFAPVGYLLLDEEGIVKNINLTACILLGTVRADIKDKSFYTYLSSGGYVIYGAIKAIGTRIDKLIIDCIEDIVAASA